MAAYITLTTLRTTTPDQGALLAAVRVATGDATAALLPNLDGTWRGKKATAWTGPQTTATQTVLDTTAAFDEAVADVDQKGLRAVAQGLWEAIPSPLVTKPALRARIIAIWKTL